ncbi:unnamed protein product [Strongylus vulgaris]|uniref:Uncharacterized protein n=1 Tax=Strongylus vulgaris TaxID=40348 RepID=A0A3P7ID34_STRVU|nr:unnamed protein product [Strongylus vulgaris]
MLEKRLVDYNPSCFEVSIDLPNFLEARVRMIGTPRSEQLDCTGDQGGLRCALDEDLAWLPDVKFTFDILKFSIREVAQKSATIFNITNRVVKTFPSISCSLSLAKKDVVNCHSKQLSIALWMSA